MDDRKEEKDAKAFREDVDYFLSKQSFTIHDFHERVLVSQNCILNLTTNLFSSQAYSNLYIFSLLAWPEIKVDAKSHDLGRRLGDKGT